MSPSRSAVYRRKRIGPRTDPCGTPHSNVYKNISNVYKNCLSEMIAFHNPHLVLTDLVSDCINPDWRKNMANETNN